MKDYAEKKYLSRQRIFWYDNRLIAIAISLIAAVALSIEF